MDIKEPKSGRIVKTLTGYEAYVPNPLPPKMEWKNEVISSLSKADHVLGMLSREGSRLPNPHLLLRPFITREAVLSSKIEGTQATLGEVLANEAGMFVDRHVDDLQEVTNYILALEHGLERLKTFPLSLRLIREMHSILMQGVRGAHATPGEFRKSQNWIGSPGSSLNTAKYVPPTPEEMEGCLNAFELFLHDTSLPPLIHIAMCHYQFEAIHPFLDGNGRIGRLLITLLLIEKKLLPTPLLYLSAFFEAKRDDYYHHLFSVSSQSQWNEWFIYFLNGVSIQAMDVLSRAERINNLLLEWQLNVATKMDGTTQNIIKYLTVNPYCTTTKLAETYGIAYTTAQRSILKLENLGIIKKVSVGRRHKVFCATAILEILEEPTKISDNYELS